mmetsp:Transcript_126670/g.289736  ORF Transcript_126670/g.289736 Transcript_126670/m.289736 type:complete len:329 (-) Transcript_126670:27-1013(-)
MVSKLYDSARKAIASLVGTAQGALAPASGPLPNGSARTWASSQLHVSPREQPRGGVHQTAPLLGHSPGHQVNHLGPAQGRRAASHPQAEWALEPRPGLHLAVHKLDLSPPGAALHHLHLRVNEDTAGKSDFTADLENLVVAADGQVAEEGGAGAVGIDPAGCEGGVAAKALHLAAAHAGLQPTRALHLAHELHHSSLLLHQRHPQRRLMRHQHRLRKSRHLPHDIVLEHPPRPQQPRNRLPPRHFILALLLRIFLPVFMDHRRRLRPGPAAGAGKMQAPAGAPSTLEAHRIHQASRGSRAGRPHAAGHLGCGYQTGHHDFKKSSYVHA